MRKYVMMGVQGSGKGTQSELLRRDLDLVHISVGDIFRWHVQNHTKVGAQVRRAMAAGELVGDDLVERIVRDRLDEHDWNFGFIVDGFPRNARQAEFFLESYDIDGVIHLELPDEEVRRRVLNRRLCPHCGMDYNLIYDRPAVEGRCEVCGHDLITRADGCATTTSRPGRCSSCSAARSACTTSTPVPRPTTSRRPSGRSSGCRPTSPT
jgi:adenylate kinase